MRESAFAYGSGYVKGSNASNFPMSDASNVATIAIMKLIPHQWDVKENCFCLDCAGELHRREELFDTIKEQIEMAMKIAYEQGKENV